MAATTSPAQAERVRGIPECVSQQARERALKRFADGKVGYVRFQLKPGGFLEPFDFPMGRLVGAGLRGERRRRAAARAAGIPVLGPTRDAVLTLVTCYPFDAIKPGGPLRYVVVAEAAMRAALP